MKRSTGSMLGAALAAALIIGSVGAVDASAAELSLETGFIEADMPSLSEVEPYAFINPLYEGEVDAEHLMYNLDTVEPAVHSYSPMIEGEHYYAAAARSISDAAVIVRQALRSHAPSVSVPVEFDYNGGFSNVTNVGKIIFDEAIKHTGNPIEGDYIWYQFAGASFGGKFYQMPSTIKGTYEFTLSYYYTAAQEAEMTAETNRVLSSLSLGGKSDYEKVRAIYNYLTRNVSYDYANLYNESYVLKYTGYAALVRRTAVCQGYSVAFYRMALASGLDARVITGTGINGASSGPHAWNIVKVNGRYYNLDCTWDAGRSEGSYHYFLKAPGAFDSSHIRKDTYTGAAFNASYPMGSADYDPNAYIKGDTFFDVLPNSFYANAVKWAVEKKITSGTGNGSFSPFAECTRSQVVTFLYRAFGEPQVTETLKFKDVAESDFYAKAVKWALRNRVTAGSGPDTFSPNAGCTRGQVVTFLWRAAGSPTPRNMYHNFIDINPNDYYYNAVLWAVENNITTGTSATTFDPGAICNRSQVVTFLYRYLADK